MVKVWDGGDVPRAASQRTRFENVEVWAMIISMTSYWRRQVDLYTVCVSEDALPSRRLMLALPRRQTIPMRVEMFIPTV